MEYVLQAKNLIKSYGAKPNVVKALDDVSIQVKPLEFISVVGSSGSGKSTLLHMLGGLDRPDSGNIIIKDNDITKLPEEALTIFRRRNIGFVFQNYNLVPVLSVYENIVLPIELDGLKPDGTFVEDVIHTLGLDEKKGNLPSQLSGGQQQRVAVARALCAKPSIILADEPTGNLDSKTGLEVIMLMLASSHQYQQSMVIITHNDEIAQMAQRIIRIEDGKVMQND